MFNILIVAKTARMSKFAIIIKKLSKFNLVTMKKSILLIACGITLFLTSCATYKKETPVLAIGANSVNTYIKAEFDYASARPIEAEINIKKFLGMNLVYNEDKRFVSSNRYKGFGKHESQALYKAIEENDVDVVIEPRFETDTHCWLFGIFKQCNIKVKGWGMNIKGFSEDIYKNDYTDFTPANVLDIEENLEEKKDVKDKKDKKKDDDKKKKK